MKCIQRRREKISSWPKRVSSLIGTIWLTNGRYFLNSLKMAKKRENMAMSIRSACDISFSKTMHFFLNNAYIQCSHAYFIKYIRSKQILSIPFACEILIVQAHWYIFWNGLPYCVYSQKFSVTAPVTGRFQTWFPYSFILTGVHLLIINLGWAAIVISTEGAPRIPMTYDNHPIPSHPSIYPHI